MGNDDKFSVLMSDIECSTTEVMARRDLTDNEKMAAMTIAAAHFIGAGAAVMKRIALAKGFPDVGMSAWAEQMANIVVAETKKGAM